MVKNAAGKGFGFLFEMGCGKTLTAIAVAGAAYEQGKVARLLIVAPTSVCAVWDKEFAEYAAFNYSLRVLLGDKDHRLYELATLDEEDTDALKVVVINYESAWRDSIFAALKRWAPDMIIADESQRIKTHNAKQSKAMHELGDAAKYKLILSGTPIQNGAVDLWSQYRFLDPAVFGTNFYSFRGKYAVLGGFNHRQVVGYKNTDELIRREHSIAYRVTKEEALDLPEQTFLQRYVQLTGKTKTLYHKFRRDSIAELESGESVTATTVLTRLLRLQQLAGGFLQTDERAKPELVFDGKLAALAELIDDYVVDAGKKLVIFAWFKAELAAITALLERRGIGYAAIDGDTPLAARGEIVSDFQSNPETRVFVAQINTAGLGITLTAADTCVYYSLSHNYGAYAQSLARIHRIGQKNTCTYIHLIAQGTVDETILAALGKKENLARSIVDDWRKYF